MTAIIFAFILHNKVRLLVRSHFCYLCTEGRNIKKDEFMKKSRIQGDGCYGRYSVSRVWKMDLSR